MKNSHVLVTGGAGFIGSHLVDELMSHNLKVTVIDNLSNGTLENIKRWLDNPRFMGVYQDLLDADSIVKATRGCEIVFHLAANPEVGLSAAKPRVHYEQNVLTTLNLLEAIRKVGGVKALVFTSSSTVYGEASRLPTPEDYAPLQPISIYGSSKLSCEALVASYAHTCKFKAIIYRLANIIGPRNRRGVVYDFVNKLKRNPAELEILGDGNQTKSYLFIDDCIAAMRVGLGEEDRVDIFNLGSDDQISVKRIARIVMEEMGLKDTRLRFTGGVNGGRGWIGDVKNMQLETSKLKSKGWTPRCSSEQAVRLTVRNIVLKRQ